MITLADLQGRVQSALMDPGGADLPATWSAETLTESLRLALGAYGLLSGAAVTVAGLDGASETTLPDGHAEVIVWGAAGYAALARSAERTEAYQFGPQAADWERWGAARIEEFRAMLAAAFRGASAAAGLTPAEAERLRGLRESAVTPWGRWADPVLSGWEDSHA